MLTSGAPDIERGYRSRRNRLHRAVRLPLLRSVHTQAAARHRRIRVQEAREAADHLLVFAIKQEAEERAEGEQAAD